MSTACYVTRELSGPLGATRREGPRPPRTAYHDKSREPCRRVRGMDREGARGMERQQRKPLAALALILIVIFGLAGCGENPVSASGTSSGPVILFSPIASTSVYLMNLDGEKLHGGWNLFRIGGRGRSGDDDGDNWMLVKRHITADVNAIGGAQSFVDPDASAFDRQAQRPGHLQVRLDADRDQREIDLMA